LKSLSKCGRMMFFFEISVFILEILTLFYYANQISDDVILFATKKWKILNKQYLWKCGNIAAEVLKFGTTNVCQVQ